LVADPVRHGHTPTFFFGPFSFVAAGCKHLFICVIHPWMQEAVVGPLIETASRGAVDEPRPAHRVTAGAIQEQAQPGAACHNRGRGLDGEGGRSRRGRSHPDSGRHVAS